MEQPNAKKGHFANIRRFKGYRHLQNYQVKEELEDGANGTSTSSGTNSASSTSASSGTVTALPAESTLPGLIEQPKLWVIWED